MSESRVHRGLAISSDFVASFVLFVLVFGTEIVMVANGTLPPTFFSFR